MSERLKEVKRNPKPTQLATQGKDAGATPGGLRLGLCCQFSAQPIRFRTTTATALGRLPRREQLRRLASLGVANAESLLAALRFCAAHDIGSFRICSPILPIKTHPTVGYRVEELPGADDLVAQFRRCGEFARAQSIRTGFHPDQFVVLNSPDEDIVARSVTDLESQAEIAEWTNADTVNIHGGGGYGDKAAALERFRRNLGLLSPRARSRLTVENDDKTFTPADLLPLCRSEGVPLVYDVHHHRCLPDSLSVEQMTEAAKTTWKNREPLFHLSSPLEDWRGPKPERHHDYIDSDDFPRAWIGRSLTVEIEAKAKELAVARLQSWLERSALFEARLALHIVSAQVVSRCPLGRGSLSVPLAMRRCSLAADCYPGRGAIGLTVWPSVAVPTALYARIPISRSTRAAAEGNAGRGLAVVQLGHCC